MNVSLTRMLSDEAGKVYGVPKDAYAMCIMCNTELFVSAGLTDENGNPTMPATWQEVAEMAVKIKEATGKSGFCLLAEDYTGVWQFENIAWNFGAEDFCTYNGDGTYTANLNSDGAVKAMEFVKSLKWEYDVLTERPLQEKLEKNIPAIPEIPLWNSSETLTYERALFAEQGNMDAARYQAFFDAIEMPGNLRFGNSVCVSEQYMALWKVMQTVLTDPDADVKALMDTANENYQKVLDTLAERESKMEQ